MVLIEVRSGVLVMRCLTRLVFAAALILASAVAVGQSFPAKPVSIIVPQAPGGANEFLARMVAAKFQEYWGSPVVVEFKPGGGVIVATQYIAKSAPDGHAIGIMTSAHAINPALGKLP